MDEIRMPKLEKVAISEKSAMEQAGQIFEPLGTERPIENGVTVIENEKAPLLSGAFSFAPPVGIEPTTNRLTVDCSTAELQGIVC